MNPNNENQEIKMGVIYTYTNKHNYTTRIIITRISDKSVFYKYADHNTARYEFRMSRNSFSKYSIHLKPQRDENI